MSWGIMVAFNTEAAIKIEQYLEENEDAKTEQTIALELNGEKKIFPALKIPIRLLFFNKENGRLTSLIAKYERENGKFDPISPSGEKILRGILLSLDNVRTKELSHDLERIGQREAGVITYDGVVINANRRMAILLELYEAGKGEQFSYLLAARLPKTARPADIFRIEASLQYAEDFKEEYNPINELLTIKRGLKLYSERQMAESVLFLKNGVDELKLKMRILDYMGEYLGEIGHPGEFDRLVGLYAHFDEVVDLSKYLDKKGKDWEEIVQYIKQAFKMIKVGCPHKTIRGLRTVAKIGSTETVLWEAGKNIKLSDEGIPAERKKKFVIGTEGALADAKEENLNKPVSWCLERVKYYLSRIDTRRKDISHSELSKELNKIRTLINKKIEQLNRAK